MPEDTTPVPEQVSALYKQLAASAAVLNAASSELAKAIAPLETALQQLNIGIVCWTVATQIQAPNSSRLIRELGYAKVGGKWGIAIRERTEPPTIGGLIFSTARPAEETWLFNDAPRAYRLEAIEHIPALLERLVKKADAAAKKITASTMMTRGFAAAIGQVVAENAPPPKRDTIPVTPKKTTGEAR